MAKRASKAVKAAPVARGDGWKNFLHGIGTDARDKRRANQICLDRRALDRDFQEEFWRADDMAARIVETIPNEMMRAGFEITIDADADDTSTSSPEATKDRRDAFPVAGGAPPVPAMPEKPPGPIELSGQDEKKTGEAILARYEELHGDEDFQKALEYERAYGGAALFIGAADGQKVDQPLNEDGIQTLRFVNVLTPREVYAYSYYSDPTAAKYGQVEIWRIQTTIYPNLVDPKPVQFIIDVHETRMIIFPGLTVSNRHRIERRGFGDSIFVRIAQVISDWQMAYAGSAILLTDFAQAVIKIKGLAELVAQDNDDMVIKRASLMELSRSIARAVIIDSEEDYERKSTSVAGLPDLLQRLDHRLAAAADMPVALIMGASPTGGLNTGDSDLELFNTRTAAKQKKHLKPRHQRFFRLIMLSKDGPTEGVEPEGWDIKYRPLSQIDDAQEATRRYTVAQADALYITNGVVTPEEIAASRFGGAAYSIETTLDVEGRQKMADTYEEQAADVQAKQETAFKSAVAPPPPPANSAKPTPKAK